MKLLHVLPVGVCLAVVAAASAIAGSARRDTGNYQVINPSIAYPPLMVL